MYYSYTCTRCGKVFYTFNDDKELAAQTIYTGIEQHMRDYNEQETAEFYHESELDTNKIYSEITESADKPSGGYEL